MRNIILTEFLTLDGVFEAPGGETSLGERGGWTFPYQTQEQGKFKYDEIFSADALLLGRTTYNGFAAAWPSLKDMGDFGIQMNSMAKYVVTSKTDALEWENSHAITGDIFGEIAKLKEQEGANILLMGSGELARALMAHDLIDEYRLMVFPVILGIGKKLFGNSEVAKKLTLSDTQTFSSGVVVLTYHP